MYARSAAVLFSFLLLLPAARAHAQAPGIDLKIIPKIGAYVPLNELTEENLGGRQVGLEAGLALGLAAELGLPFLPVDVRLNLEYATGSELSFSDQDDAPEREETGASVLLVVGDLVWRPLPRALVFQPYLLTGAGIRNYEFDLDDTSIGFAAAVQDDSDLALHLGLGADVGLGPLGVIIEVSDYISWFTPEGGDSRIQNDVFAMIGFRVGML